MRLQGDGENVHPKEHPVLMVSGSILASQVTATPVLLEASPGAQPFPSCAPSQTDRYVNTKEKVFFLSLTQ